MDISDHVNAKFSADESTRQLERLLLRWWQMTSRSGLSISARDIEELENSRRAIIGRTNEMFDQMVETAQARSDNLQSFGSWKVISIGEDCFSRTIFTRWGVKPSAAFGEKSTPFDLSIHPVSSLVKILESDFSGYLDDDNLVFAEDANYCRNKKYRVGFNHEVGSDYAENGFEKLKQAYMPRIERFKRHLETSDKICFVLHIRAPAVTNWTYVKRLWDNLKEKCTTKDAILICISTWKHGAEIKTSYHEELSDPGIHIVDVNYPFEKYIWHKSAHLPDGHTFERGVIDHCASILRSHVDVHESRVLDRV